MMNLPQLSDWVYRYTTGASLTAVTVKVAGSLSVSEPSLAVKVIVSLPNQLIPGIEIVATLLTIDTVSCVLPELLQIICASVLSISDT